ncbi:hypothetical protein D9758_005117 [Tetrapyrgos nigripes]|uniref:G domain-containing protein n=1 Tax=Tetrapyrgos nigripes TaxID=182062 RepID=A0A8H5GVY8_9AGAR|nr:hypothetical protein D9758_005117 [Tetrapyrgos nigripes]
MYPHTRQCLLKSSRTFATSTYAGLPRLTTLSTAKSHQEIPTPRPAESAKPSVPKDDKRLRQLTAEVFRDPKSASLLANVRPSQVPAAQENAEDKPAKSVFSESWTRSRGRANSGKSSLFNAVAGRTSLIQTSSKAGRTRRLDFFRIGSKPERSVILVDAPGYGERGRPEWGRLFDEYVRTREELRRVFITFTARHPIKVYDVQMLQHLTKSLLADFRSRMFSNSPPSSSPPQAAQKGQKRRQMVAIQPVFTKIDLLLKDQAEARKLIQTLKADIRTAVAEAVSEEIDAGIGQAASATVGNGQEGLQGGVNAIVDAILLEPIMTSAEMKPAFGIEEVRRSVVRSCFQT